MRQGEFDDPKKCLRECKKRIRQALSGKDLESFAKSDNMIIGNSHGMVFDIKTDNGWIHGEVRVKSN